jgi:hypothetical protein
LYVIDAKVPERARLDIFERVNGGVPLTRQQMRNCLFMGNATRFLKTESTTPEFLNATGKSLKSSTMRDREFVNRFCAFHIMPIHEYRGDMDEFLAQTLKNMNKLPDDDLAVLSTQFRRSLLNNFIVFGKHAFRKHRPAQVGRSVLNASLWDVMSTGLATYPEELVRVRIEDLRSAFYVLLEDEAFNDAITYGTNDMRKVNYRFQAARTMFQEVLGAPTN